MPGGIARHQFLANSGKRARQVVERQAGEEHEASYGIKISIFVCASAPKCFAFNGNLTTGVKALRDRCEFWYFWAVRQLRLR